MKLNKNTYRLFLFIISSITFFLYLQGVNGPFLYDDHLNLSKIGLNGGASSFEDVLDIVFGNSSGFMGRSVSMLSFLLNAQNWPADPYYFKFTNICLHIIIGWLIYLFSFAIIEKLDQKLSNQTTHAIAFLTATLWLLHPIHVSTTLYVIQRMTQLSALFSLLSIIIFLKYYQRLILATSIYKFIIPSTALFITITLAVLSKENAVLIFPILILIHFLIAKNNTNTVFRLWFFLYLIFPTIIILLYFMFFLKYSGTGFELKGFTLQERLFTELRIISDYIIQIVVPDISRMALFHDDINLSSSIVNPRSTLLSLFFILFLLTFAYRCQNPVYKLSIAWFFIWHLIESTALPLYLYFEHRNYTASIGLILGISYRIFQSNNLPNKKSINLRYVFLTLIISLQTLNLNVLTKVWADEGHIYLYWLNGHEKSKLTFLSLINYYERRGDIKLAYQLSKEGIKHPHFQSNLGIYIKLYTQQCILKKDTQNTINKLSTLSTDQDSYGDSDIPHITTLMLNISKGACEPQDRQQLHALLHNIEMNSPKRINVFWRKALQEKHAYLYLAEKNYNMALDEFTKSHTRNKPDIRLAIIDLNIILKNYANAEKWLSIAENNISNTRYGVRDISGDLEKLRLKLKIATGKK